MLYLYWIISQSFDQGAGDPTSQAPKGDKLMKSHKLQMLIGSVALLIALAFGFAAPVQAFDGRSGDKVIIGKGEVITDDLYVSANTFILEGTVKGDLVVIGSVIRIEPTGVVEGSLMAAGQGVVVNGAVRNAARLAGFSLSVGPGARIGSDLVAAGFSVDVAQDANIGQDVIAAASQITLAGVIKRNARLGGNGVRLQGLIGGNVEVSAGEPGGAPPVSPTMFMPQPAGMPPVPAPFSGLEINPKAKIGGSFAYTAAKEVPIPTAVVGGTVTYNPAPASEKQGEIAAAKPKQTPLSKALSWFVGLVRNLATLLLLGLLIAWLLPGFLRKGAEVIQAKPLPSLLWGLVAYAAFFFLLLVIFIAVLIVAIALGIVTLGDLVGTTIGLGALGFGGVVMAFKIAASYLSKIIVGYLVGWLILTRLQSAWAENRFLPMAIGVVIFAILASIPLIGWIVNVAVILLGLGALWSMGRQWWEQRRAAEVLPAV